MIKLKKIFLTIEEKERPLLILYVIFSNIFSFNKVLDIKIA